MPTKYEYADEYVSRLEHIPTAVHWAIIETGTHRGEDEQGRDSVDYVKYEVYLTEEKWKNQIQYREESKSSRREYRAIKVAPAQISVVAEVKTEISF